MNQEELALILETISKLQQSPPNQWIPVASALGGALIGGFATFLPARYFETRRERKFSEQVKRCIVAEVSTLVRIIESRKYIESIEKAIEYLKSNPEGQYTIFAEIPAHYCLVYQEQCKNLGVLEPEIAENIISFYQLIDAVVQDIKTNGTFSTRPSIEGYQQALEMFKLAFVIGKGLKCM